MARSHFGVEDATPHDFASGAALTQGSTGWALLAGEPSRSLGRAIVWASRLGLEDLHLLADDDAGIVARRAACFRREVTVWQVDGVELGPPDPQVPEPPQPVPDFHPLVQLMRDAGLEVVADDNAVVGEFNGLEVARLVAEDDGHRLDVGVGAYDQDAFALMNADLDPHDGLAKVVAEVQRHRVRGAAPHPINRLVRERWLRAELVADPSRVGAVALAPVASMVERDGLHDILPAAAVGADAEDQRLLVVCSVGIDLDLVPTAGELASYNDVDRIVFVLPERDHHPVTVAMADELNWPVRFDIADCPWPPG